MAERDGCPAPLPAADLELLDRIAPRYTTSRSWDALRRVAEAKGCNLAQLAIAWVAAQGADIVPLVGARTRTRLAEGLPAVELRLTAGDLVEIEKAVPAGSARGDRYPAAFMASLGVGS